VHHLTEPVYLEPLSRLLSASMHSMPSMLPQMELRNKNPRGALDVLKRALAVSAEAGAKRRGRPKAPTGEGESEEVIARGNAG